MFRIVTDGSVDMPDQWAQDYEIDVMPLNIQIGAQSFQEGINITRNQFYDLVRESGVMPKTSLPSSRQVADFYRRIAVKGDTILSIHLGSRLSGTFATIQAAAKELADQFEIYTYDSGGGSAMLAYMCRDARLWERAGLPIQDILHRLDWIRQKVILIFTVDNLEFARLSGRVNHLQSSLSSLLNIKPIIILRDGLLDMSEKVRTRRRALERVVELVMQAVGDKKVNVAVVHARDLPDGEEMLRRVRSLLNCRDIFLADLSIPVAAHLGPGTIGIVAYPVDEER